MSVDLFWQAVAIGLVFGLVQQRHMMTPSQVWALVVGRVVTAAAVAVIVPMVLDSAVLAALFLWEMGHVVERVVADGIDKVRAIREARRWLPN